MRNSPVASIGGKKCPVGRVFSKHDTTCGWSLEEIIALLDWKSVKYLIALVSFLVACAIGQIVLVLGNDYFPGREGLSPFVQIYIYGWVVVFASPFWLFTFVPLYLIAKSDSFVWRWYVASLIGLLIGLGGALLIFGREGDAPRNLIFPASIGFFLFLFGAISKMKRFQKEKPN